MKRRFAIGYQITLDKSVDVDSLSEIEREILGRGGVGIERYYEMIEIDCEESVTADDVACAELKNCREQIAQMLGRDDIYPFDVDILVKECPEVKRKNE